MQKLKVLVLGSGGQLGKELKYNLTKNVSTIFFDKEILDITNYDLLKNKINNFDPSIIINTAAFTNVNKAEENKKEAFSVNSDAVGFLSNLIAKKDIWLIHFSTDYVFDGEKNLKYKESDATKPLNVYGMSKLSGEKKIIESCCKYIIFRTSWVYGEYGYNFIKKIVDIAKTKKKISVVSDQKGVPTSTYLICRIINKLIQDISMDNFWAPGIYHLVPNGRTTWFEMAQEVARIASDESVKYNFKNLIIEPISNNRGSNEVKRPRNSLLCNKKLQIKLNFTLPNWNEDFLPFVIKYMRNN